MLLALAAAASMALACTGKAGGGAGKAGGKDSTATGMEAVYRTNVDSTMTLIAIKDNAEPKFMPNKLFYGKEDSALVEALSPAGKVEASVSCFIIETQGKRALFDTGNGTEKGGKLMERLAEAGIAPDSIDYLFITHFHNDHIGGMTTGGKAAFGRAEVYVPRQEYDYWVTNGDPDGPAAMAMRAYEGRLHRFEHSQQLPLGIVPMAAYAIERRRSRFTGFLYTFFIAGMMVPFHLYMFPLFREMKVFGIFGTMAGPIVSYIAGSISFGTLLYCSFLKGIPLEIEEASVIDGCTPFQTFWKITFRLLGPCNASMVILNGLGIWNDYLMPYLVLPSGRAKTITVEIAGFVGQFTARWDIVFAGTIISIVPALAIFCAFQKYFVKGITAGAAKG